MAETITQSNQTEQNKNKFIRQVAIKLLIKDILNGKIIQNEDEGTYLETNSKKVFRVNLISIIVRKEKLGSITSILIDDGSGKITLKSFEENDNIKKLNVGDIVLITGKSRVYNNEKYVSPEIIKKVDPLWLKYRSIELKDNNEFEELKKEIENEDDETSENNHVKKEIEKNKNEINEIEDEIIDDDKNEEDVMLPVEKIIKLIKELDEGDGVAVEQIIEKSMLDKTEELIERMMEKGEIYQNQPGKVKVL